MGRSQASKNKGKTPFEPYEGREQYSRHLRLTHDMLLDPAYLALSLHAKTLYTYMKDWAEGEDTFTYSASLAETYNMPRASFYRARNELVEKGFINYLNSHLHKRDAQAKNTAGEYKFSKRWSLKQE